jgi:hypothetical protein
MPLKPTKLLDGQVALARLDGIANSPETGIGCAVVFGAHEELEVLDGEVMLAVIHLGDGDQFVETKLSSARSGRQHGNVLKKPYRALQLS